MPMVYHGSKLQLACGSGGGSSGIGTAQCVAGSQWAHTDSSQYTEPRPAHTGAV